MPEAERRYQEALEIFQGLELTAERRRAEAAEAEVARLRALLATREAPAME